MCIVFNNEPAGQAYDVLVTEVPLAGAAGTLLAAGEKQRVKLK